jgi:anti-sigma-K factor RskA
MTPDDQSLAAELALGLLDGQERATALERLLAEPAFAAEVAWWRQHLDTLLDDYAPADAPPGPVAVDAVPPPEAPAVRWPWVAGGAAGGALAASLAAMTIAVPPPAPVPTVAAAPPPLVAVLVPSDGQAGQPVAAVIDRRTGTLRFTATIAVPDGRVAELWRIGADKRPRAIGVLTDGERPALRLSATSLPGQTETLAISIEPIGGSPTGQPTGPVIATGSLVTA